MHNDKMTLKDLSIFNHDGEGDIFSLIDHTTSQAGKEMLRKHIQHPPDNYDSLMQMQGYIKFLAANLDKWPSVITNGTIVMVEKFFESSDNATAPPIGISLVLGSLFQKALNKNQYFFTRFSLSHISDFLKGCLDLVEITRLPDAPDALKVTIEAMAGDLDNWLTRELIAIDDHTSYSELVKLSYNVRRDMKGIIYRLINHYAKLDAWHSMARATVENKWSFPQLLPARPVCIDAQGLTHPLLEFPVPYDVYLDDKTGFLLLTGANMSGKTTFMRSIGVAALLAHLGMGAPAVSMRISFLQGIITNMQVEDNLVKGESYFFAEVQRMKSTAQKLLQSDPHLVLMDELFKGTNVHDAYECTKAVVEGLLNRKDQIMILSTHLYEVAQHFTDKKEILFNCFVTNMLGDGSYNFTYELKKGISDDRIGYKILQREGVLDLLKAK